MYQLSKRSSANLETCVPPIILLCHELIKVVDFTVLCGHRGKEDQDEAERIGNTTKKWPYSLHNKLPSPAIDLAPYPIWWQDTERFAYFAGWVMNEARRMGIPLIWGGDWDGDFDIKEHRLIDMPHFQTTIN